MRDATVGPELGTIDPDFDLIENRVLDSLGFVNFLYVLEEQTGREISLDQASPEDFRAVTWDNGIRLFKIKT